jgi:hypothetical protein
MMDDERTRQDEPGRVHARTSKRVSEMSEAERVELARELARRRGALPDPRFKKAAEPGVAPAPAVGTGPEHEAVVRLTAELRATERSLDRLERSVAPARYSGGSAPELGVRYERLLSRAERIERKLRGLR